MKTRNGYIGSYLTILAVFLVGCASRNSLGPELQLSDKCIEMTSSLSVAMEGIAVLRNEISFDLSLRDLNTGDIVPLGKAYIAAVSPENKRLAYTEDELHQLIVTDSAGERLSTIAIPDRWSGVIQWISPSVLLIQQFEEHPFIGLASSVIYNVESNDWQELPSVYPGVTSNYPPVKWENYSYVRATYDPSLSRVAYAAAEKELGEPLLILRDMETQRELARFYQGYDISYGGAPQWFQDGSYFVAGIYPQHQGWKAFYKNDPNNYEYKGGYDLFLVSREGEITRLTYLTTKYQAGEERFSLSPDQKKIAFWMNLDYTPESLSGERTLSVLDISSGNITNLCINANSISTPPIWSPEGKSMLVSRYYTNKGSEIISDVLLVDLEHRVAVKIGENVIAKGWLIK